MYLLRLLRTTTHFLYHVFHLRIDVIGIPIITAALTFVELVAGGSYGTNIPTTVFQYTRSSSAEELVVLQSCSELVMVLGFFIGIVIDVFPFI